MRVCVCSRLLRQKQFVQSISKGFVLGWTDGVVLWIMGLMFWFGGTRIAEGAATMEEFWISLFCLFYLGMGAGQAMTGATDQAKAKTATCE